MHSDQNPSTIQSPFAHVVVENFLPEEQYRNLVAAFPWCPPGSGPTGFALFRGDADYARLMTVNETWSWFYRECHTEEFVRRWLAQFEETWAESGCLIDTRRARYADYFESRPDKERRHLENVTLLPEDLWIRLDILQGRDGYRRKPHLDHRRRLLTMLIYLCDAEENGMVGGSLILHGGNAHGAHTHGNAHGAHTHGNAHGAHTTDEVTVVPRHNLMVAFPCGPDSFHSVSEISELRAPRNFVQITISSSVDAWPS